MIVVGWVCAAVAEWVEWLLLSLVAVVAAAVVAVRAIPTCAHREAHTYSEDVCLYVRVMHARPHKVNIKTHEHRHVHERRRLSCASELQKSTVSTVFIVCTCSVSVLTKR